MELLLNLVWAVLSISAAVTWYASRGRYLRGHERARQAIALLLLVSLLFPVISLTDDYQAAATLAETEHPGRKLLSDHPQLPSELAFVLLLEAVLALFVLGKRRLVASARLLPAPLPGNPRVSITRGPPVLTCA